MHRTPPGELRIAPGAGRVRVSIPVVHVLVTGGAGFIGSHLVEALLARGDRVTAIDDCSTGDPENLAAVRDHERFALLHGSVCDEVLVDEACLGVEAIFHLAAAVGVRRILEKQVMSIVTNLHGTETILRAATAHGRIPVFLASTSEVYGKGVKAPFAEDDDSVLGATGIHRWSYACTKAMDEFLALAFHRERALPVRIGRFFNITGPRQSAAYGMVLPNFCERVLAGEPCVVHGDGEQTRCFLHVADCVDAVLRLAEEPLAVGRVVNIGGEEEVAIGRLAELVGEVRGKAVAVDHVPYERAFPEGGFEDMRRRVPDTARLRELTGWRPRHDLRAIVADCLETCRENLR